jgi:hypothetical protein
MGRVVLGVMPSAETYYSEICKKNRGRYSVSQESLQLGLAL